MAFILALLKTTLDILNGEMDRDGTLGSQEGNPLNCTSSINHTTVTHLPMWVSGNALSLDTARSPFPLVSLRTQDRGENAHFSWCKLLTSILEEIAIKSKVFIGKVSGSFFVLFCLLGEERV